MFSMVTRRVAAAAVAAPVFLSGGCSWPSMAGQHGGPKVITGPDGEPLPLVSKRADLTYLVLIGITPSELAEIKALKLQLASLADAATEQKAYVLVMALGAAPDTEATELGRGAFGANCRTDNPRCPVDATTKEQFLKDVEGRLATLTPAAEADVPGGLALISSKAKELRGTTTLRAVLIGRLLSTSPACSYSTAPKAPETYADTAAACMDGYTVNLTDIEFFTSGLGQSAAPGADAEILRRVPALTQALVTAGGGGGIKSADLEQGSAALLESAS